MIFINRDLLRMRNSKKTTFDLHFSITKCIFAKKQTTMKKRYIFLAIVCLIACSKDDIEPIPVGVAINNEMAQWLLLFSYDKNRDGILSKEEALAVRRIHIQEAGETIEGLEHFPNVEQLTIYFGEFTDLDLSSNLKLQDVSIWRTNLQTLDVTNNTELRRLVAAEVGLESITLGNQPRLEILGLYRTKLTSLDVTGARNLIMLGCTNSLLTEIDLSNNPHLEELSLWRNQIETLDVSRNPKLRILNISRNKPLTSIDVSNNPELIEFLVCGNILLTTLDVSNNPNLRSLLCRHLTITTLDVSNNPNLWQLHCWGNANLTTIYLRTGQTIERFAKDDHVTIVYR